MEKIALGRVGKRLIQHKVKLSTVLGSNPMSQVLFFHIVQAWWCFNWFKVFLVDKSSTFSDSKLVTHVTNSTIFSIHSAVFS